MYQFSDSNKKNKLSTVEGLGPKTGCESKVSCLEYNSKTSTRAHTPMSRSEAALNIRPGRQTALLLLCLEI